MTTSDTKNAIESAIKPINDIKIESAAVKSGLPTAGIVTKTDEVKIKAPVKMGKKVVVKKAVAAPARAQAPREFKSQVASPSNIEIDSQSTRAEINQRTEIHASPGKAVLQD